LETAQTVIAANKACLSTVDANMMERTRFSAAC